MAEPSDFVQTTRLEALGYARSLVKEKLGRTRQSAVHVDKTEVVGSAETLVLEATHLGQIVGRLDEMVLAEGDREHRHR